MLATKELSVVALRALQRSFTRPVSGLACSQKKQQANRSISSRSASSAGENEKVCGENGERAAAGCWEKAGNVGAKGATAAAPANVLRICRRE